MHAECKVLDALSSWGQIASQICLITISNILDIILELSIPYYLLEVLSKNLVCKPFLLRSQFVKKLSAINMSNK